MTGTIVEQRSSSSLGLLMLAILLGIATGLAAMRMDNAAIMVTPFVMGAMNTLVRSGQGAMAVTYMTGNLVKLGQTIVAAFQGGSRWAWLPSLLLWLGLVAGVLSGAVAYGEMGLVALCLPAVGLIGLAFMRLVSR
jgi:uncharacterized membrane protein YoaK (UPF0700 family)